MSAAVLVIVAGCAGVSVLAFAEGLEVAVMSRLVLPALAAIAALVGAGAHLRTSHAPAVALILASAGMASWYYAQL